MASETDNIPCALIVMGVSGSGKSTIGERLAERLGWSYEDGDKFHPASNVAKMSAGHPLTDEDRWPWLMAIADEIDRVCHAGEHAVIACSALQARLSRRAGARARAMSASSSSSGTQALIADRLAQRKGHFMPPGLLASQFETLEPPEADENPCYRLDRRFGRRDRRRHRASAQARAPSTAGASRRNRA